MDFGKVSPETLPSIDFTLPADTALTKKTLAAAAGGSPKIYVGCAKWGRKEWVGKLYPKGTKDANFLDEYVKHFNSIELNATFYKIPDPAMIAKWAEKSGDRDFLFFPKFSQVITHIRRLKNAQELTDHFIAGIHAFGEHLGPAFLQVGDNFTPKSFADLRNYLEKLPADLQVFVELRGKEWFADPQVRADVFAMFRELKKGAVITDAAGRRDCVHMELPTPAAFIRFVGNSLDPTDYSRIDAWVNRMDKWIKDGIEAIYFFMHQHDERYSPELIRYLIEKMNKKSGLKLQIPQVITVPKLL